VYGTLIDAGSLALLWRLTRREGIRLRDLLGFERSRPGPMTWSPWPAALYGVLVWPFLWGLTEQMSYNGYLVPSQRTDEKQLGNTVAAEP
jgi:uncharacterized protein